MSSQPVVPTQTPAPAPVETAPPQDNSLTIEPIPPRYELPADKTPAQTKHETDQALSFDHIEGHQTHPDIDQQMRELQTKNNLEAAHKNYLYEKDESAFKKQYPFEWLYRKGYNFTKDAIMAPAERGMTAEQQKEIGPQLHQFVTAGLGALGAPEPGQPNPVIKTGAIMPEGAMEEGALDFSSVPGYQEHPVEIAAEGPEWDRTHRMSVGGQHAGSVGYHVNPQGEAQVYGSHVQAPMRGQGIGQAGYKSVIEEARANPNIKRITSDPTNVSSDAARVWQKLKEKGEPVEEITHPNGKKGYKIEFQKPEAGAKLEKGSDTAQYRDAGAREGIEFRGVQEGIKGKHPGLAIYQDPKSGTSIAVRLDEFSPVKLTEHLKAARERMGIKQ